MNDNALVTKGNNIHMTHVEREICKHFLLKLNVLHIAVQLLENQTDQSSLSYKKKQISVVTPYL